MNTDLVLGTGFVFGTVLLVMAGYLGMRLVARHLISEDTKELAGSIVFRIAALHGLMLALVFAQEMQSYQLLEAEIVTEANAIADIYNDVARHGSEKADVVQGAMSRYLRLVSDEEWQLLAETGELLGAAWGEWDLAYQTILDLDASTDRRASLRDNMLAAIHRIAETRDRRISHGLKSLSGMFWFAAVSGVIMAAMVYFGFPPTALNLLLISFFAVYTGLVMFFIHSFSNPFAPPGAVTPAAMERLIAGPIGQHGG